MSTATTETSDVGDHLARAWPLFASIFLLMAGSGLQGSLLGVRAEAESFTGTLTGGILGLYYLGYVAGSSWVPGLVRSVGHIRVFAAFASLASAAVVVHGVFVVPLPWMALRFVTGLCVAGLFIVSESWLNDVSTPSTRGTILGTYNTVVTAGLATGSLLLNVADSAGLLLFVLGSVLLSLAAVPVALAPHDAPAPRDVTRVKIRAVLRTAPIGVFGSSASGFITGATLGYGAVYATRAGFGVSGASQILAAALLGAVAGQIPLGRWSDRTDRRRVILVASGLVAGGCALGIAGTEASSFTLVVGGIVLIGAGGFSLYGLSFSHLADYADVEEMPAMGARLITTNGLGAAGGPIAASLAISAVGPEGFFWVVAAVSAVLGSYTLVRMARREAAEDHDRVQFAAVPTSATVGAVEEIVDEVFIDEAPDDEPTG